MVVEAIQFGTQARLPQVGSEPVIQAVLDLLPAATVACGGEFIAAAGQVDGFPEQAAQGCDLGLFLGRGGVAQFFAAAQQMPVATALGDFQDIVAFQAIDHEVAIEVWTEDVFGNLVTACALARANDVDGDCLTAEDPQPGILAADAPAGFIGMDNVALPQGFPQQVIGWLGQVGEALLGARMKAAGQTFSWQ